VPGISLPALAIAIALGGIAGAGARAQEQVQAQTQVQPQTLRPGGTPVSGGLLVLSGSLHDHSTDSDGDASSAAVAAWEFTHRNELGIDFGTLTDHADLMPFAPRVPFGGNVWKKQARLDARYTREGFSLLRGFEFTSDQENHVGVIGSPGFLGGPYRNDLTLDALYHWIATRDAGIVQFNHPSSKGALQWDNLAFVPAVAANVATIEVYGDQGFSIQNLMHSDAGWYWLALARGWTLGPVMNWDTHHWRKIFRQPGAGERCGDLSRTLPCQRTLVLADAATPEAILRALHARRTTATEHPSLWATLRGPGGIWQGGTIEHARAGRALALTLEAGSSIWPLTRFDIVSDNGIDPHAYYDGDNSAKAVRRAGAYAAGFREQHRRYVSSGGYALRKAQIDGPPEDATLASGPLAGNHTLQTIVVTIPAVPSVRPDRKHFFYAIVWSGLVRAWTSPIFTDDSPREAGGMNATLP
jgi:hypothetical protein